MAQLITLSKLATLVSENTGIEITVCEAFIRNMAQTTASGLIEGEHIRIKDFGLFELRHSVDGTATVEFIPETQFAERVNAPYAHLRPSEVSKRIDTNPAPPQPAMPENPTYPQQPQAPAFPRQPDAPAYASQSQAPAFPRQPDAPAYASQPQAPAFPQQPDAPAYASQPQAPAFPRQPDAPAYASQPQAPAFPQQPDAPAYASQGLPYQGTEISSSTSMPSAQQDGAPDLPSYLNLPALNQPDPDPEPTADTSAPYRSHPTGFNRQLPQLSTNNKYILIGVLGLIIGFVLGYLTANYSSGTQKEVSSDNKETAEMTDNTTIPPTEQEYDYNSSLSVADTDSLLDEDESIDTPEVQPQPEAKPISVKLQRGQRLSDIALKHYGKKEYWVYIYLENRENISNPFTVREGVVLRIPPKDKYAPTTDEATNLAWAKSKAAEINNKYQN